MHNPDCTHGGSHHPKDCRDRWGVHLKPIEEPEHAQTAAEVVETGDEALKLLLAAAGNVEKAEGAETDPK